MLMNQILLVAELVLVKAWRQRIFSAVLLLMIPFLVAAWMFEVTNPGFQSGLSADLGGSLLAVFAAVLLLLLASEHFFWVSDTEPPWFYLTRIKSRTAFFCGRFVGVTAVLFVSLLIASLAMLAVFRFSSGIWNVAVFQVSYMVFLEFAAIGAVLSFMAGIFSRLLSAGLTLLIFVVGHSLDSIRQTIDSAGSATLSFFSEIILVAVPDLSLFRYARLSGLNTHAIMLVTLYAVMIMAAWLVVSGISLHRRDF